MDATYLLHHLVLASADRRTNASALTFADNTVTYGAVAGAVTGFAAGLISLGLRRSERVAIYLEKRPEAVIAFFGSGAAAGTFVPVNPILKPEQVGYILRDCNVRVLVTSPERFSALQEALTQCPDLHHVVLAGDVAELP